MYLRQVWVYIKFYFNPKKQVLSSGNHEIVLSHRENQLLKLLYENRNTILDRKHALITLWGDDSFFNTRTMDV
ncbi:MAG: DNA-binding response regulator, partial [Pedobacter sp.]